MKSFFKFGINKVKIVTWQEILENILIRGLSVKNVFFVQPSVDFWYSVFRLYTQKK